MSESLRFIHSADLHLDSLFKTKRDLPDSLVEQLRASTFKAFDLLIKEAIRLDVDFVLIVGDLFDEEVRSLKAQVHLREGFALLNKHAIPVYVTHGNHDFLGGAFYPIDFPDNVHIFNSEKVEVKTFKQQDSPIVNIYGFSYLQRVVKDRKVEEFVKQGVSDLHIAMLHGSLETNTDHDVYAPFKLDEMYRKQFDYWALGHIHKRQTLTENPPIVYPGNIQGRSRKESGEKGCYLVEYQEGNWSHTFVPLQAFIYKTVSLPCHSIESPHELEYLLNQAKEEVSHLNRPVMLNVELISSTDKLRSWQLAGLIEEWVSIVNEMEDVEAVWIWIDHVRIIEKPSWREEELIQGHHFPGEWLREWQQLKEDELNKWLSPLFNHRKASKYLEALSAEEKQEVIEEAKVITLDLLLKKEDLT